jgi:[ribosomal protein S5]-alanine N-acetyltransferase
MLQTTRLHLCPITQSDFEDTWLLQSDPAVMHYIRPAETNPSDVQTRVDKWIEYHQNNPNYTVYSLKLIESGEFIGYAVIRHVEFQVDQEIETGYCLAKKYWQQGYATEALLALITYAKSLQLTQLVAFINPKNSASKHVLEKCGFVFSGKKMAYNAVLDYFVLYINEY